MLKKLFVICVLFILVLTVGYKKVYKLVPFENPDVQVKVTTVFYKNSPFTGTLLKKVPLTETVVGIDVYNGSIISTPVLFDREKSKYISIPFTNDILIINFNKTNSKHFLEVLDN